MIDFDSLESKKDELRDRFRTAEPFRLLVIDNFCTPAIEALAGEVPDPNAATMNLSRDYVFAKNKFEKSNFAAFGPNLQALYDELVSDRFAEFLSYITGSELFVDPKFHGGGIHQGGEGSFLDMHADFNYHPLHNDWFRSLNILLYLNDGWTKDYRGELKLRNKDTGKEGVVEPLFNRCVIMDTRSNTLHGYDPISFPPGRYRRSIAAYAYELDPEQTRGSAKSTTWYPTRGGALKSTLGRMWPQLVTWKTRFFGSGTSRNA